MGLKKIRELAVLAAAQVSVQAGQVVDRVNEGLSQSEKAQSILEKAKLGVAGAKSLVEDQVVPKVSEGMSGMVKGAQDLWSAPEIQDLKDEVGSLTDRIVSKIPASVKSEVSTMTGEVIDKLNLTVEEVRNKTVHSVRSIRDAAEEAELGNTAVGQELASRKIGTHIGQAKAALNKFVEEAKIEETKIRSKIKP